MTTHFEELSDDIFYHMVSMGTLTRLDVTILCQSIPKLKNIERNLITTIEKDLTNVRESVLLKDLGKYISFNCLDDIIPSYKECYFNLNLWVNKKTNTVDGRIEIHCCNWYSRENFQVTFTPWTDNKLHGSYEMWIRDRDEPDDYYTKEQLNYVLGVLDGEHYYEVRSKDNCGLKIKNYSKGRLLTEERSQLSNLESCLPLLFLEPDNIKPTEYWYKIGIRESFDSEGKVVDKKIFHEAIGEPKFS